MKKFVSLLLVAVFAFSLVACGGSTSNVDRSELIGDWYLKNDDGVEEYLTLTEDGKYLVEAVSPMGFTLTSEHTWTYADGVFTVDYADYGTTSVYQKVTLNGNVLTLDNGQGTLIYTRR